MSDPDFKLFIGRPVVEVAVLVLVEDVNDVRIVGADYVIVDDYLVLIYRDRLPCFIITALKDVQNISWNIVIRLRALNLIRTGGFNLRLGVNPRSTSWDACTTHRCPVCSYQVDTLIRNLPDGRYANRVIHSLAI